MQHSGTSDAAVQLSAPSGFPQVLASAAEGVGARVHDSDPSARSLQHSGSSGISQLHVRQRTADGAVLQRGEPSVRPVQHRIPSQLSGIDGGRRQGSGALLFHTQPSGIAGKLIYFLIKFRMKMKGFMFYTTVQCARASGFPRLHDGRRFADPRTRVQRAQASAADGPQSRLRSVAIAGSAHRRSESTHLRTGSHLPVTFIHSPVDLDL